MIKLDIVCSTERVRKIKDVISRGNKVRIFSFYCFQILTIKILILIRMKQNGAVFDAKIQKFITNPLLFIEE